MKSEFITLYEELDNLNEANMSANDYANYTDKSLVRYKIFGPSAGADSDKTRYENSGITFRQAVEEIIEIISKLPTRKKFGITIHCEFLDETSLGAEAFYLYTFKKEYKNPATIRFNTRSTTPAPDFVRIAGQRILDTLEVTKVNIEEKVNSTDVKNTTLKESRSVADIEAEIAKLKQELEAAKVAEKRGSYEKLPTKVGIWDICRNGRKHSRRGTSAELYEGKYDGAVFETEDDAIDAGYTLLYELADEGELPGGSYADPDDFDVEAFQVNISDVDSDTLIMSNLEHLM